MDVMKVLVKPTGFGLNSNGVDPMELALEMDGDIPIPLLLLKDLFVGGFHIFTETEWFGEFLQLLLMIEPTVLPVLPTSWPDGLKQLDAESVVTWCGKQTWIVDPMGFVPRDRLNTCALISTEAPQVRNSWSKVIEVRQSEVECEVWVDGRPRSNLPMSETRFFINLGRQVNALIAEESVTQSAPKVVQPTLKHAKGQLTTTLAAEIGYLQTLLDNRLFNFISPDGPIPNQILDIIITHTERQVEVSGTAQRQLRSLIGEFVRAKEPILITISMAIGCRIPNSLKYSEMVQLPTFAWLYMAWFFKFINEKVKTIYEPGIRVVFFDEATLFAELMELDPEDVRRHLLATRALIKQIGAPIEIIEMEPKMFEYEQARQISVGVTIDKIYAIAMSMQDMTMAEAMDPLYVTRDKDWAALKRLIGPKIWDEAERRVKEITQVLAWRKKADLFGKILGRSGVDACITDKDERIVFDVTANALINHGIPVVERKGERLVVRIVPEYRVEKEYPNARPVYLDVSELGVEQPGFDKILFYYLNA
ncbi:hypothetical protein KC571_02740 [candidate division WWE3 bacterium]|uniref:Uncharacterized protein n=1 Tax=candidate division WWE3 bacterium TaxID=2053526 RepID=A0A955LH58_UNCKA|nr:hypothetical protein [candidate division WWE3 bacterium]